MKKNILPLVKTVNIAIIFINGTGTKCVFFSVPCEKTISSISELRSKDRKLVELYSRRSLFDDRVNGFNRASVYKIAKEFQRSDTRPLRNRTPCGNTDEATPIVPTGCF